MSLTRKAFLGVAASVICATAFGGAIRAWGKNDDLLRPPLVLDEAEFLSRCIRCYRCISVCHTGAIVPATVNDGAIEARTPKLNYHQGICDFCNECVKVCPTAALTYADPFEPSSGRIGEAVVIPERCLAYSQGCTVCVDACPYGAMHLSEAGTPLVDSSRCNGCGVCENVCPALVYRSFGGGTLRGIVVTKHPEKYRDKNVENTFEET